MKLQNSLMSRMFLRMALAALGLFLGSTVYAAQDAMVTVEDAPIREKPSHEAKVLEIKSPGNKLRISSENKEGWYKTRTASGQFGWIWQSDITILSFSGDVKAANLEPKEKNHERRETKEPWLFLRLGGLGFGLISSDISSRLGIGAGHITPTAGVFSEVAVRVDERLRIALRLARYSSTEQTVLTSSDELQTQTTYEVAQSGTPLLFGLDADVSRGESFDISAGLYAGFGLNNTVTVTATSLSAPNSFSLENTSYAALINFSMKYWFSHKFSLVGELGGYFTQIPKAQIADGFNGDGPFRDSQGQLTILHVNHIGPIVGLGLEIAF